MKKFVYALLFAAAAATAVSNADGSDRPAADVSISRVVAQPESWMNTPFKFEGRFHRMNDVYQAFYTPFDSFSYANFSAWDITLDLSQRESFLSHCPTLYVNRQMHAKALKNLAELRPFERFRAEGIVRTNFAGLPFVQITKIESLDWWKFWLDEEDFKAEAFHMAR